MKSQSIVVFNVVDIDILADPFGSFDAGNENSNDLFHPGAAQELWNNLDFDQQLNQYYVSR